MRGLDPRIHPSSQGFFEKKMDGRVKPGHDAFVMVPALRTSASALHRVRDT
jgi:hypothetical protein